MASSLKNSLLKVNKKSSGSELLTDNLSLWEVCHRAAFEIKNLEYKLSLMEPSFKAEILAAYDCSEDEAWNQWSKEMISVMGYGNDELGYKTGQSERDVLAIANSDLRSEVLSLNQRLFKVQALIKDSVELIESSYYREAVEVLKQALMIKGSSEYEIFDDRP